MSDPILDYLQIISHLDTVETLSEVHLSKMLEITGIGHGFVTYRDMIVSIVDRTPKVYRDAEIGKMTKDISITPRTITIQMTPHVIMWLHNHTKMPNSEIVNLCVPYTTVSRIMCERIEAIQETRNVHKMLLTTVSHELRTPLNGIIGLSRILKTKLPPGDFKSYADVTHTCGMQLVQIINDLLDHSRIHMDQIKLMPTHIDLIQTLMDSANITMARFTDARIRIQSPGSNPIQPNWIYADEYRIKQIMINLLCNAVKYSKLVPDQWSHTSSADSSPRPPNSLRPPNSSPRSPDSPVCIHYTLTDVCINIEVIDAGVGIPDESREAVFEPFMRCHQPGAKCIEGTGLGLYISRKIARIMGGDLLIKDSIPGKGTTMLFTLPRRLLSVPRETKPTLSRPIPTKHRPRILVVDDIAYNLTVIQNVIEIIGNQLGIEYEVTKIENAVGALNLCSSITYDVVFMDLHMPGSMDGYALTRAVFDMCRFRGQTPPRVIAMTAYASDTDRQKCRDVGMSGFISKPIQIEDVQIVLEDPENPLVRR